MDATLWIAVTTVILLAQGIEAQLLGHRGLVPPAKDERWIPAGRRAGASVGVLALLMASLGVVILTLQLYGDLVLSPELGVVMAVGRFGWLGLAAGLFGLALAGAFAMALARPVTYTRGSSAYRWAGRWHRVRDRLLPLDPEALGLSRSSPRSVGTRARRLADRSPGGDGGRGPASRGMAQARAAQHGRRGCRRRRRPAATRSAGGPTNRCAVACRAHDRGCRRDGDCDVDGTVAGPSAPAPAGSRGGLGNGGSAQWARPPTPRPAGVSWSRRVGWSMHSCWASPL